MNKGKALSLDELKALDSEIDIKIRSLPILQFSKNQTILDLVRYVDFTVFIRYSEIEDTANRNSATMNLLDGFSFLLEWVLKYCPNNKKFSFLEYYQNRVAAIENSIKSAVQYSVVFDHMAQLFRNKVRGYRKGNKIFLDYTDSRYSSLDAATRLLSGIDLKRATSHDEIDLSSYSTLQNQVIPNVRGALLGYHYSSSNIKVAMDIADNGTRHLWELDGSWDFDGYTLDQFRTVWKAIQACMHIHLTAIMNSDDGDHRWFSICAEKKREEWINILERISDVPRQQVEAILDDLTFDVALYREGSPRIDIRYQPFIPIDDERMILSSSATMISSIERNLFHLLSIKRPAIHSRLSTMKEKVWINELQAFFQEKKLEVKPNIQFTTDGSSRNIDLLVLDRGDRFLLAIEMK